MAVGRTGTVYVADFMTGDVSRLDAGNGLARLQSFPTGEQDHCGPVGLAVDPSGTVYVASTCREQIVAVSPARSLLRTFTVPGTRGADWIAVDGSGTLFATAGPPGELLRYPAAGGPPTVLRHFAGGDPDGVAVDRQGHIFVGLVNSDRVVELSASGAVLASSPTFGAGPGQNEVDAVAVDTAGFVYITQGQGQESLEVDKLSPQLRPLATIVPRPGPSGISPFGLAVGPDNSLYICQGTHVNHILADRLRTSG